ncbi:hypothetical protein phiAS5_ORF0103 [Aeromonas phage phiAS5]|uniref:Uncharacterized protein n=1 Tax=Aeromonas phage phiAS5 TaxID=879630 RepID=E1A2K0_9CAUD|nr:hypothetical protein phiAS5_ORF0103 [Aeromonas phage phiAS5]ADM79946.1 hypothetical protein phiAS5_ORF0103 [Aeromonas phage phiAS5]
MFISSDDADKINPAIKVHGIRKDAKQRRWFVTEYDGVPQTGESYCNGSYGKEPKPTKNGHFVYRAQIKIGRILSNYNGSAYYIDGSILANGRDYKIQIGTNSFPKLMKGILENTITVIDAKEMVVEFDFILEKYGRYVMAELVEDISEWL